MTTSKGIFYFPTFEAARDYAEDHDLPTDRIIEYLLGWAIQFHKSGPYVGPLNMTHSYCRYCPEPKQDDGDAWSGGFARNH